MTDFPEKTCSIDRLVTHAKFVSAAIDGSKTQQRRDGVYGYPGEKFELEGTPFVIKDLRRQALAEMTDEDARNEGYPDLESYRQLILRMHPGMNWDAEMLVWVHEFAKLDGDEN